MDKHIVCFDFGGVVCENVKQSHFAAAQRWGAQYHVFREPWGPVGKERVGRVPIGFIDARLDFPDLPFDKPCRVCYLDGDVIVRSDCESLFDLVPSGHFGAVQNYQGDSHPGDPWPWHMTQWLFGLYEQRIHVEYRPEIHLNGGVLVFDLPFHAPIWRRMQKYGIPDGNNEQATLSFMLEHLEFEVEWLDKTYNRVGPAVWEYRGGPMPAKVCHLAKMFDCYREGERRDWLLNNMDWRATEMAGRT